MYSIRKQKELKMPWNKGKLIGQKMPLNPQEIWAIRIQLQNEGRRRDLALFNLAIDSKLRASDLLNICVSDVARNGQVHSRAMISQRKTRQPVRFEITKRTRISIEQWIEAAKLETSSYLFPSRQHASPHLSTRQYSRIVESWCARSRSRPQSVRHSFDAQNQGNTDLPPYEKPEGGSVAAGTHKTRQHGQVSGN